MLSPHLKGKHVCMTLFQTTSPTGGGKSAVQNYGRADQFRGLEAFIMLLAGGGLVLLSFTYHSSTAFIAWMLLMGCSSIAYGLHRYIIYAQIHQAERRWHCDGTRVVFVPPWLCETGEILVNSMMTLSSLLSLCLAVLSGLNEPGDTRTFLLSLLTTVFCAFAWASTPLYHPGSPVFEASPYGIHLRTAGLRRTFVSWDSSPRFQTYGTIRGVPRVTLATSTERIYFSIGGIPLGCEQLHKLLIFYRDHPELRDELTQQHGLERVRELMYASLNEVEAGLARERTQSANQPAPSPPPPRQRPSRPPASRSASEPPTSAGNGGDTTSAE